MADLVYFGRRPEPREVVPVNGRPDWQQCDPRFIDRALKHALGQPGGGWFVLGASRRVARRGPERHVVAGEELVVWRVDGYPHAAPAACPHLGADLSCGHVDKGRLVCPWHGLRLGPQGQGAWRPYALHDDGVLLWVRLPQTGEPPSEQPYLAPRPSVFLDGVVRLEADCEPEDVIANRLDPWHGVHFHPHSFATLSVLEMKEDVLTLRVAYRLVGRLAMEVDATFHCPDPRTIVMTIVNGEGVGSVVETHATPLDEGRTAIVEATLATSERDGFARHARTIAGLARPLIERRAARLWAEDAEYAERRYALRQRRQARRDRKVHLRTAS